MKIIYKIKEYGILGTLRVVRLRCSKIINGMLYYLFWIFPTDKNLMVFESEGDLSDNSFAFFSYLENEDLLKRYTIVWLVENLKNISKEKYENTFYIKKFPKRVDIKRSFYLARCKYYIYDHCNVLEKLYKRESCQIINLWHGCGFKAGKGVSKNIKTNPDYMLVTGELFKAAQMEIYGYSREMLLDIGYPRNDYFFKTEKIGKKDFLKKMELENANKIFLWMPTFRQSVNKNLSEEYFMSITGLPVIDDVTKLERMNTFFRKNRCVCIFKLHHLQAELKAFDRTLSNIKVVVDDDLRKLDIQLYEMVSLTDCLITDYSSVATDYMLLDKPILYTIDDYEDYRKSRGFFPENPKEYFAGHWIESEQQLKNAFIEILENKDKFQKKRMEIIKEMHTYLDGNASERLMKFLGL